MTSRAALAVAGALLVAAFAGSSLPAQEPAVPPPDAAGPPAQPARNYSPQELDQMTAPIALYPDPLISKILMAATYPVDVVMADRWLQDPNNAALHGDQLNAALQQQEWDPSVKSLVPFPQILQMMDTNLDWTETIGDAFLADQAGVMDSIQRLRHRAQSAGKLTSNGEETVTSDDGNIVVEPPGEDYAYVPVCDPTLVYGEWPYPSYPPDYFSGFGANLAVGDYGCGWWSYPIVWPLWGWDRWDWRHHRIDIDRGRFTALNGNQAPRGDGTTWQHNPVHRHSVPYSAEAVRDQFGGSTRDMTRDARGYPDERQDEPRTSPSFESFERGSEVRSDFERGYSSRSSMPSFGGRVGGGGRGHR